MVQLGELIGVLGQVGLMGHEMTEDRTSYSGAASR
jgi:hypothetical protein